MKIVNTIGYICLAFSFVFALFWIILPEKRFEPFTVALGTLSAILLGIGQWLNKKNDFSENMGLDKIIDIVNSSKIEDWIVKSDQNSEFAYLQRNPLIRIISYYKEDLIKSKFHENWIDNYLDKTASMWRYGLYFNNSKLENYYLITIDGARGLLPLPKSDNDLKVKPIQYKIAKIFDRFNKLDFYMKIAGISVEDDR